MESSMRADRGQDLAGRRPSGATRTFSPHKSERAMQFMHVAETYVNLDQVAFIRQEEHAHLGPVVAIHFAAAEPEPLYIGQRHFEEIGAALTRAGNLHVTEAGSAAGS